MFDEEDDDYFDGNSSEEVEKFEKYLNGGESAFFDSDKLEMILDHYLMNGQYSKANQTADFAITQFGYNALFYVRKAQAMSAMGQLKEALNMLALVEKWQEPNCEFLLTKASIFSQLRDYKRAIKFFKDALAVAELEDRDEIYMDLAMEYENVNDYKNALAILEEALISNPKNEAAIYEKAFCYNQMGEFDKAIKAYTDFIDENPYSFTSWYNLGNAYSQNSNFEEAIWAYEYCVAINEDFGPVYFNMGNSYLADDKYEQAIENFQKCMEIDGDDPVALCYLGECYEQTNDLDKAEKCYRDSIAMAPYFGDAWLGLGIVFDLRGIISEAITFIEKAIELEPENAGYYHVLAGAFEKNDELPKAQENYIKALSLDSTDEDCLISYIELLQKISPIMAQDYIETFMEISSDNESAILLYINLLYINDRKSEALEKFLNVAATDKIKAKEIFDINPDLLNVREFVLLTED